MNRKKKGVSEFSQIYIIIALKDEVRKPVFYTIMKGKSNELYKRMYSIINEYTKGGMRNKQYIMGDMEILNHQFLNVYGNIEMKVCYFHYSQSLLRMARSIKNCTANLVYGLKSLAIAPLERVDRLYKYLKDRYYLNYIVENKDKNEMFIQYFEKNYLSTVNNWNVSNFHNRTNNYCESLNRDLKRFLKRQHVKGYRDDYLVLKKLLCKYISERKEMDENRTRSREKKYNLRDKIISQLIILKDHIYDELMIKILGIISRKRFKENIKDKVWTILTQLTSLKNIEKVKTEISQLHFDLVSYVTTLERAEKRKEEKRKCIKEGEEIEDDIYETDEDYSETEEDYSETDEDFEEELMEVEDEEKPVKTTEQKEEKKPKIIEIDDKKEKKDSKDSGTNETEERKTQRRCSKEEEETIH